MMSKPMQESYKRMLEHGKNITHDDYYNNVVHLVTDEGSTFTLNNSCFIYDPEGGVLFGGEDHYIWVYTEHSGELIFARNEVALVAQYKKIKGDEYIDVEK